MNIDQEYLALIHSEIDGENTETDSALVREYLSRNPKARQLYSELTSLNETIARVDEHEPPRSIRSDVFEAIRPLLRETDAEVVSIGSRSRGIGAPWLRYAYAFAAGLILGVVVPYVVLQDRESIDPETVAGSLAARPSARSSEARNFELDGVSGSVVVDRESSVTRLEFELASVDLTEVVIGYDPDRIRFKGFDQASNEVSGFSVTGDTVSWTQQGRHRVTIELHTPDEPSTLDLRFLVGGAVVHGEALEID